MTRARAERAEQLGRRVQILAEHELFEAAQDAIEQVSRETAGKPDLAPIESLDASLAEIGIPVRIANALEAIGITTLGELLGTHRSTLLAIPNVGDKCLREILSLTRAARDQVLAHEAAEAERGAA